MLSLEEHWTAESRPSVPFSHDENEYDRNFEDVLEKNPLPDNFYVYGQEDDNADEKSFASTSRIDKSKILKF